MQIDFVIYSLFIGFKLIVTKAIIFAILRNAEMFNIGNSITLPNNKVGRIGLFWKKNIILIHRLIFIVDVIQIQKICNFHLLMGTHYFALNCHWVFCANINNLLFKLVEITTHCGKIWFCNFIEKTIEIFTLIRSIKVWSKKQNQVIYKSFVL